jgi:hypothetical protein
MTWSDTFLGILKDNDVRLISYVPDNVLTPLLKGVTADNYSCLSAPPARTRLSARSLAPIWPGCAAR